MYCHPTEFTDETPFWMVWNPQGHAPTHKHPTALAAKAEAERLARTNPGAKFIVLQALGSCSFNTCQWTMIDHDPIPF